MTSPSLIIQPSGNTLSTQLDEYASCEENRLRLSKCTAGSPQATTNCKVVGECFHSVRALADWK
jgi:hypothetical protein